MGRRQFNPTTRKFDERMVVRKQEAFNYGMVSDSDPVDIPYNAVAHLENARGHKNAIKGRTGIRKWSDLRLPTKKQVTITKNGNLVSIVDGSLFFDEDDAGCCAYINNNVILFTDYTSETEMTVAEKVSIPDGQYTIDMRDKINAQYYDFVEDIRYILVGRKLYARKGRELVWVEFTCINDAPSNTMSQIFKIEGKYIIVNNNGIYAFNSLFKSTYMYKMNGAIPAGRISDRSASSKGGTLTNTYRYLYTYSRMQGGSRLDGVEINIETPPMYSVEQDYGQVSLGVPITKSTYKTISINSALYNHHLQWVTHTETKPYAYISVIVGGVTTKCYLDFSAVESMADVAKAIELSLIDASATFNCVYKIGGFYVYNSDPSLSWTLTTVTSAGQDDMAEQGIVVYDNTPVYMGATSSGLKPSDKRRDITHYSVYRTADIDPHTKTPADLLDPRIGNNPDIYAWVADVPLISSFEGSVTLDGGTRFFNASRGGADVMIGGQVFFYVNGASVGSAYLEKTTTANKYKLVNMAGAIATNVYATCCANSGQHLHSVASKSGVTITATSGIFTSSDVGTAVFWGNGAIDIIASYVSPTVVTTLEESNNSGFVSIINYATALASRTFYDDVSDITRIGYAREFTLKTRFMEPVPSTNIGCYHNGVLLLGKTDQDKLWYTDTKDFKSLGYHNSINQANDSLNKNVQCMFVANDLFGILTTSSTYTINPKQATVVANEFGEFFTRLPDPYLVNNSIGAANQFRWSRGEKGDVMVVTSEPAVRFFDGVSWTANLANEKVQHTELQLMSENMISSYSGTGGIHIWGYRSSLWM